MQISDSNTINSTMFFMQCYLSLKEYVTRGITWYYIISRKARHSVID